MKNPRGLKNTMLTPSTFDWTRGSWSDPLGRTPDTRICIAGDWAPIRDFKTLVETRPESVYGDLLPLLRAADLAVVNLEAPLSDSGSPVYKSGAVFKGEDRHVHGLTAVPFHVATLANNHVLDYGIKAFSDTLAALDRNAIRWTGAGMSIDQAADPLILTINGTRITIINFSEGEDLTAAGAGPGVMGWDLDRVEQAVREAKPRTDFILVIAHCGIEYIPFPPPYVVNAFQRMAEAGADLVIGHHPHVPQGIGFHKSVPLCYSLGNFIFFQPTNLMYRKLGYLVTVGLNSGDLVSLELTPYAIHDRGVSTLDSQQHESFFTTLKELSMPLNEPSGVEDAWHGFLSYYGNQGFMDEVTMILDRIRQEPRKGAAMFRNRMTTLQHYLHWKDLLTRMVDQNLDPAPEWAKTRIKEYLTRTLDTKQ
ncbi:MAG: CapA family protein [Pseudomonadota bacterium]